MKKLNVKLVEYVPKEGKCLKAVIKSKGLDGNEFEHVVYAKNSIIQMEHEVVSVQEVTEEEYNEWLDGTATGLSSLTGAW